jgi:hypothetical protein
MKAGSRLGLSLAISIVYLQTCQAQQFKELEPQVKTAWQGAGARHGGLRILDAGLLFFPRDKAMPGEVPSFQFSSPPLLPVQTLPQSAEFYGLAIGYDATDADLKAYSGLTNLRALNLMSRRKVTDAGLKELAGLKKLEILSLNYTGVTDGGMKTLAEFKELRILSLVGVKVTDQGVKELAPLTNLWTLTLMKTDVTGATLAALADAPVLKTVILRGAKVNDAGLKGIVALKGLKVLDLSETQVTGQGLKQLIELKQLEGLILEKVAFNDADVAELRKALPKLKIVGP